MNILDRTIHIRMSQVEVGAAREHVRTHRGFPWTVSNWGRQALLNQAVWPEQTLAAVIRLRGLDTSEVRSEMRPGFGTVSLRVTTQG